MEARTTPTIAELQDMTPEQLAAAYDGAPDNSTAGTESRSIYWAELARREQRRQTEIMENLNEKVRFLTTMVLFAAGAALLSAVAGITIAFLGLP